MRSALLFAVLGALSACGDPLPVGNSATPEENPAEDAVKPGRVAVRIGELGPNFAACSAAGTTRNLRPGESLPVRPAPFENAEQQSAVPANASFFVCTRTLDQKWFGIVYEEQGDLAERCGVSEPVTRRRDYEGPCRAGWVQSAFVKVIAGNDRALPVPPKGPTAPDAPPPGA
ncbi:MAG TPA: hypothetical protein VHM92_05905 [Allosphingosinicella sp.]|nr:hypothetical protein [Allosphingosinicella sp.]